MEKHKIFCWYSNGDDSEKGEERLLELLNEGWKVINAVSDGCKIIYILKK